MIGNSPVAFFRQMTILRAYSLKHHAKNIGAGEKRPLSQERPETGWLAHLASRLAVPWPLCFTFAKLLDLVSRGGVHLIGGSKKGDRHRCAKHPSGRSGNGACPLFYPPSAPSRSAAI